MRGFPSLFFFRVRGDVVGRDCHGVESREPPGILQLRHPGPSNQKTRLPTGIE